MYRLLIVDDESHVVDWLYQLFLDMENYEFDIYKAYSASAALLLMKKTKIDIIITDINMPKMDGLQLVETIRAQWPECRVIFLTGYNEFEYAYKAIQEDVVGYVLKTEADEELIKVVEKAVKQIENSRRIEEVTLKAEQRNKASQMLIQREFLNSILESENNKTEEIEKHLSELEIPMKVEYPLLLLLGRIDNNARIQSYVKRSELIYGIEAVCNRFLRTIVTSFLLIRDSYNMVWFIQPSDLSDKPEIPHWEEGLFEKIALFVRDTLETIQTACRETFGVTVSFVLGTESAAWDNIAQKHLELRNLMDCNLGLGNEMLMSDKSFSAMENNSSITENPMKEAQIAPDKTGAMIIPLQNGQRYLYEIQSKEKSNAVTNTISKIMQYVCNHLNEDISLVKLADLVYFNPSYLSRLFKQVTGNNLTDFIFNTKADKAKQLLGDSNLKIHEVASAVGYDSSTYFARFFRKMTGINPQEYRDSILKR